MCKDVELRVLFGNKRFVGEKAITGKRQRHFAFGELHIAILLHITTISFVATKKGTDGLIDAFGNMYLAFSVIVLYCTVIAAHVFEVLKLRWIEILRA